MTVVKKTGLLATHSPEMKHAVAGHAGHASHVRPHGEAVGLVRRQMGRKGGQEPLLWPPGIS